METLLPHRRNHFALEGTGYHPPASIRVHFTAVMLTATVLGIANFIFDGVGLLR
jgi:hypothetical protein